VSVDIREEAGAPRGHRVGALPGGRELGRHPRGEWLAIETQNVNAAVCRFYQKMGCTLGAIDRFAYPGLPGEAQLLWWRARPPMAFPR
jgi:hypothetical protein